MVFQKKSATRGLWGALELSIYMRMYMCGSSRGLFRGGAVGGALSLALLCLCALGDIGFKSIFGTFAFSQPEW